MSGSAYDVLVVGSGPAGAMAARDLARAGARVAVLERGRAELPSANPLAMWRQRESVFIAPGVPLLRGMRAGGGSTFFFQTAVRPPSDLFPRYGINLGPAVAAVEAELPVAPLAESLVGPFARRIREGGLAVGLPWRLLPKILDQEACRDGCPPARRWNATRLLTEATSRGAALLTGVAVERVLAEGGRVSGVLARRGGEPVTFHAPVVVLAAGALATPLILRAGGLPGIDGAFFSDPLVMVMGTVPDVQGGEELAMAAGYLDEAAGYMLADMTIPGPFYRAFALASGRPDRLGAHGHTLTIMVKIRDDITGVIDAQGRPRRRFGPGEKARMRAGIAVASRILQAAGARHVFTTGWTAAHPGGTVPLGRLVDAGLATALKGLYVCDASVIPEPWGRPPTLTLLALGKYLAARLAA